MSSVTAAASKRTLTQRWEDATNLSGVTTASLLVVLLVATAVGAIAGLALDDVLYPVVLAILAGLLGTVLACLLRNTLLVKAWG